MLRWMFGKTRKDRIKNTRFREHLRVASIGNKIRSTCLRWFGHHVQRMAPVRKKISTQVHGPQRRGGGPKRMWIVVTSKNRSKKVQHISGFDSQ